MSSHVRWLRGHVGHDLLLLPSVTVLVRDDTDRVLLVRSADEGRWMAVGGAVDPDETPREAAVREAREEAGVDVEITGIVDVVGGPGFVVVYPNGDRTAYVSTVFAARVTGGAPRPDGEETTAVGWFRTDELAGLDLVEFTRRTLHALGLVT